MEERSTFATIRIEADEDHIDYETLKDEADDMEVSPENAENYLKELDKEGILKSSAYVGNAYFIETFGSTRKHIVKFFKLFVEDIELKDGLMHTIEWNYCPEWASNIEDDEEERVKIVEKLKCYNKKKGEVGKMGDSETTSLKRMIVKNTIVGKIARFDTDRSVAVDIVADNIIRMLEVITQETMAYEAVVGELTQAFQNEKNISHLQGAAQGIVTYYTFFQKYGLD